MKSNLVGVKVRLCREFSADCSLFCDGCEAARRTARIITYSSHCMNHTAKILHYNSFPVVFKDDLGDQALFADEFSLISYQEK